jgi:hypothetical protein
MDFILYNKPEKFKNILIESELFASFTYLSYLMYTKLIISLVE